MDDKNNRIRVSSFIVRDRIHLYYEEEIVPI